MKRLLARAALLAGSLLLVVGLFEVGLRLAGYQAIYEVYSKPSIFWTHDPLLGWRHEPGASGTYVGPRPWPVEFRTPIRINRLGLRGPELTELPPEGLRVLLLGDSFVAGFEVAWDQTFPVLIERELSRRLARPVQVINAGVRGYGTDQAYLYYRSRGRELQPDLVVMFHSGNDPDDNTTLHRMRRPFGKAVFAPGDDGALTLVGEPVPRFPLCSAWALDADFAPARFDGLGQRAWCQLQTRLADHSALLTFATLTLQRMPGLLERLYGLGSPDEVAWRRALRAQLLPGLVTSGPARLSREQRYAHTWAIYRQLDAAVREDGARFLAVIGSNELQRFEPAALASSAIDVHRLQIQSRILRPEDLRFANDAHFNATGHRLLAGNLAPAFAERLSPQVPASEIGAGRP